MDSQIKVNPITQNPSKMRKREEDGQIKPIHIILDFQPTSLSPTPNPSQISLAGIITESIEVYPSKFFDEPIGHSHRHSITLLGFKVIVFREIFSSNELNRLRAFGITDWNTLWRYMSRLNLKKTYKQKERIIVNQLGIKQRVIKNQLVTVNQKLNRKVEYLTVTREISSNL